MAPQFIESHHPLSSVRNEFNAVTVEGAFAEKQLFVGKGAGSFPTGSAVLSDVSALAYDYHYEYKKLHQENFLSFSNEATVEVVVSFSGPILISVADFKEFKGGFQGGDQQSMQGTVKLEKIREWSQQEGVNLILVPGAALEPLASVQKEALTYA